MVAVVADGDPGGAASLPLLDHLGPEQLRALAYASAIGREFDFPLLVRAMGAEEEPLAELVERLTHIGILRERSGGDRFGFVREDVRARIYQSLTASRLRVLHRKIAEAMERQFPEPPAEILSELGRHYFLGRVPAKSFEYNRRAATLARTDDAPEVAAHHLERARIDLPSLPGDHTQEIAELDSELGDLYFQMGDVRLADRLYAEALDKVPPNDPRLRARLLLARAEVARDALQFEAAAAGARSAHELLSGVGDLGGIAHVHRILGRVAYQKGAFREALDEGMQALELVQRVGAPKLLGRLCIDIGNTFSMLGPEVQDEASDWYQRAIDHLGDVGDWGEMARAYRDLAVLVGERRPTEGLDLLEKCREYAERAHEPRWIGFSLCGGVPMRLALGQVEEAERDNDQARRIFERLGHPTGAFLVALNAGVIAERRGQWEDGEARYGTALELAKAGALDHEAAEAQFHLARLWYKTRDIVRARRAYDEVVRWRLAERRPPLARAIQDLGRDLKVAEETGRSVGDPSPEPSGPAA